MPSATTLVWHCGTNTAMDSKYVTEHSRVSGKGDLQTQAVVQTWPVGQSLPVPVPQDAMLLPFLLFIICPVQVNIL